MPEFEEVNEEQYQELEAEETEGKEEDDADVFKYQISSYPSDMTLQTYDKKKEKNQLVIPEFQRNYVWDIGKASKLIESFLLGLPVPGVFLYKERKTNKLLVIDGQQRILSAVKFFQKDFNGRLFKLKNVNSKWEGKTYDDLDEADQLQLDDTVLRATVVQQLDPEDDSSIYYIFERLNTGGINLNAMEIRKCVYFGRFMDTLQDINDLPNWRAIIGLTRLDKRLKDVELILRVLALSERWGEYEKPMKSFLNNFMAAHTKRGEALDTEISQKLDEMFENFSSVCDQVVDQLGGKAFHLHGRLNYAAMDSIMAALMILDDIPSDLERRFYLLRDNSEYISSISVSTSDEKVVKKRMELALAVLGG